MTMPPSGQWPPVPQGPPQYWGPTPPPSKRGGKMKWVLGGLGILLLVVITVAATLLLSDRSPGGADMVQSTTGSPAEPTGALVSVITTEQTCSDWIPINNALASAEKNGWDHRNPDIPATAWTTETRSQFEAVASAFRSAAGQSEELVEKSANLVFRLLYGQFANYARAYADKIPMYQAKDEHLARVTASISLALTSICDSIASGSAQARAGLTESNDLVLPDTGQGGNSAELFMTQYDQSCAPLDTTLTAFASETAAWQAIDPSLSSSQWSPEQKALNDAVVPGLKSFADTLGSLGDRTSNEIVRTFLQFSAKYRNTFAAAIPTYTPADNYLNEAATGFSSAVNQACMAASG